MNTKHVSTLVAMITLSIAFSTQAHDPKEHMKDAEKPDCATMKGMDHRKMGMDDPVMQAMMKKCMKDMKSMHRDKEPIDATSEHGQDQDKTEDKHTEHRH